MGSDASTEQTVMDRACSDSIKRPGKVPGRADYCWNDEIVELSGAALEARRCQQKRRRKAEKASTRENYEMRNAKNALRLAVWKSQRESWKRLWEDIDHNTWAEG